MRTRASVIVSLLLLVVLSACAREAGPTPAGGGGDPGPGALSDKLDALSADVCYQSPAEIPPPDCQKYVTQVAAVPETVKGFDDADRELHETADQLAKAITAYRQNSCGSAGTADACPRALADISEALTTIGDGLAALPGVGGGST